MKKLNKLSSIKKVLALMVGLFIFLVLYLAYFEVAKSKEIASHPNNPRNWVDESHYKRGSIYDRNLTTLAESSLDEEGRSHRVYPKGELFAHIIGYSTVDYGRTGLEESFNDDLLNVNEDTPIAQLKNKFIDNTQGRDLVLTMDARLQEEAQRLLEGHKGSIVLMDVKTGEIYAMMSMPTYDPNKIEDNWHDLINDKNSVLLNRSSQGLYTPGSVIKVLTSVGLLENLDDFSYIDESYTIVDGYRINNYNDNAYGEIGLETALVTSSNTYFVDKGLEVGVEKMEEVFNRFLFGQSLDFELAQEIPVEPFEKDMDINEFAAALYGQGKTLVTPLQMAMSIGAIANEGKMLEPKVVKEIHDPNTKTTRIYKEEAKILSYVTSENLANELKSYLKTVVDNYQTATTYNVESGGKTGTAETASGLTHAWYLGFAPVDNPKFAVSVILEEDGTLGGQTAAPIGASMLDKASELIKD